MQPLDFVLRRRQAQFCIFERFARGIIAQRPRPVGIELGLCQAHDAGIERRASLRYLRLGL